MALISVGTPLFREASERLPVAPSASSGLATPVFAGITIVDEDDSAGPVRVVQVGIVLGRVLGPISENDMVGFSSGNDYLEANGDPSVAQARESIDGAEIKLIQIAIGAGGGGTSLAPRWG